MNRLIHDDCLVAMDRLIAEGIKVDMILTDPPYGISFQSNRRKMRYSSIKSDNDLSFLDGALNRMDMLLKDNSHIYMFCSWHKVDEMKIAFEKYFKLKNILIWEKNNIGMGDLKGSYAPKYEMILFGHKGRKCLSGYREPDVLKFKKTGNKLHPTQKPVDLLQLLINKSSCENDVILDPFMGSGSTGVACMNTGRDFIGIELDEKYYDIAKQRLSE